MYYKKDRTMFYGFLLPRGPRSTPKAPAVRKQARRKPDAVSHSFIVRLAEPGDERLLHRLAALDSSRLPAGPLLVGEMGGGIQAAVPVMGGRAIANPFVRTAELVSVLQLRAEQMRAEGLPEPAVAPVIPFPRRQPTLAGRIA
jgi:hypothetical protein